MTVRVEERIDVDTDRLYGPIDGAIKYLKEIRAKYSGTDISLGEHWTGYEDMEMTFVFTRDENALEKGKRVQQEEYQRKAAERAAKDRKEREADLKELTRLKSKLGVR